MVYKVCLSGSHYTGKTSLAKAAVGLLGMAGVEAKRLTERINKRQEVKFGFAQ